VALRFVAGPQPAEADQGQGESVGPAIVASIAPGSGTSIFW
jgi:hypothetical protein